MEPQDGKSSTSLHGTSLKSSPFVSSIPGSQCDSERFDLLFTTDFTFDGLNRLHADQIVNYVVMVHRHHRARLRSWIGMTCRFVAVASSLAIPEDIRDLVEDGHVAG